MTNKDYIVRMFEATERFGLLEEREIPGTEHVQMTFYDNVNEDTFTMQSNTKLERAVKIYTDKIAGYASDISKKQLQLQLKKLLGIENGGVGTNG